MFDRPTTKKLTVTLTRGNQRIVLDDSRGVLFKELFPCAEWGDAGCFYVSIDPETGVVQFTLPQKNDYIQGVNPGSFISATVKSGRRHVSELIVDNHQVNCRIEWV